MSQGQQLPAYVKPAVLAFKDLELQYLNGLPLSKRQKLVGQNANFEIEKWHIRQYGDVAFTIAGVKPCAVLAYGAERWYNKELVEAALFPLMKPGGALVKAGFELHPINDGFRTSNRKHPGFPGGWVLVNTRHAEFPLVRDTFLTPHRGPVPEEQIGKALGYPTLDNGGTITYLDETESEDAGVCCVPVIEYFSSRQQEDFREVLEHYDKYREVWEQLGRSLALDTTKYPELGAYIEYVKAKAALRRRGLATGQ